MSASNFVHTTRVPLRWGDFDRYGHVMNANYIELAQEARVAFADDNFFSQGHDFPVFVRRLEADYFKPILSDTTEVTVETTVVEIGTTSFITRQEIKDRQNRLACVIECVQVAVDLQTESPRPLTDTEIGILTEAPKQAELTDEVPDYGDEF